MTLRTRLARIAGGALAAITISAGLAASPANAAMTNASIVDNGNGTVTVAWSGSATYAMLFICSSTQSQCAMNPPPVPFWTIVSGLTSPATIQVGTTVTPGSGTTGTSLPAGTYRFELEDNATPMATLASGVIGSGGGGSSASTASAPIPAALSLAATAGSGVTCKDGSVVTGYVGQWLTLPGQRDCTLVARPNATLLGWSTAASFPVAIAQRQSDHAWGAYTLTNATGDVTAVFVPAGHQTFVTGPNTLHPIWSA